MQEGLTTNELRARYAHMYPQPRRDDAASGGGTFALIDMHAERDAYAPLRNVLEVRIRDMRERERHEQSLLAAMVVGGLSLVILMLHLRTRRS